MNRFYLHLLLLLCFSVCFSQTDIKLIKSKSLRTTRAIKVQLPRNYDKDEEKRYPVCVVLDGDYLFDLTAGVIDYFSYWGDMPETIVVGINQAKERNFDVQYSNETGLPVEQGAKFFEFIGMEVLPYIQELYRTENFNLILGHGATGNFINYFLLKEQPLFQAYIALSPDLLPQVNTYVADRLTGLNSKLFYYLATTAKDDPNLIKETELLKSQLNLIDNDFLKFSSKQFTTPTHFSMPAHGIASAFESIFYAFQPISKEEYKNDIVTLETSPVDYLVKRYADIEETFGVKKQILINDFLAIEAAIDKNESFDYLEDLGKLAQDEYPDKLLGHYYLGRYYESIGKTKKAMKTYRSGYVLDEIGGITKDVLLDKAEKIKYDFGY